ncbi:hypothetical protein MCOR34_005039 [Pyricularia oryzae]|nr:hypothetical protein MCOR34_005039 [Pyricularia oryzae]
MRPFFSSRPPKRELLGYRRATITYSTTRTDLRSCPHNHRSIATMALLGLFKSEDEKRADELRQGTAVPKRAERQRCWDSRDKYFACLDKAGIIDALKDDKAAAKACKAESNEFEQNCAAQWVTHFKKYRLANYQKEQRLKALEAQGAVKMDSQVNFK